MTSLTKHLLLAFFLIIPLSQASAQTGDEYVGAVYAMDNDTAINQVLAYGRRADGSLELVGGFPTGGLGGIFDAGEGLDPLISAYSLILTEDNQHLLAVNAGDSSLSVFSVNDDRTLTLTDVRDIPGTGPNSVAVKQVARGTSIVYVASIDADGEFTNPGDQEGALNAFRLNPRGQLISVPGATRTLPSRPAAIQFSPDGEFLVVTAFNAGSATLASGSSDELLVYAAQRNGLLSDAPVATAASSRPFDASGRNLPSAIGVEVVEFAGAQYVVVSEARELQNNGALPAFFELQTGSISTWELGARGALTPVSQDVLVGDSLVDGQRTTCWLEFSNQGDIFWAVNSLDASISTFSFADGNVELIEEVAAQGRTPDNSSPLAAFATTDGFIDISISDDGLYLYQMLGLAGTIAVYAIGTEGLTLIQEVSDFPLQNIQGIAAF